MASVVQIWRQALVYAGSRATVQNQTDATREAQALNNIWEATRDTALSEFWWDFLTAKRTLSELSEDPPSEWDYVYQQPSDCLEVRYLIDPDCATRNEDDPIPFETGFGTGASEPKVIWTDLEGAEVCYTKKITDVNKWSAAFRDALAWRLAVGLAMTEIGSPGDAGQLQAIADARMERAMALSANHGQRDPLRDSEGIRARE